MKNIIIVLSFALSIVGFAAFSAQTAISATVQVSVPSRDSMLQQHLREAHKKRYSEDTGSAIALVDDYLTEFPDSDELWEIKAELHLLNASEVNFFRKKGQLEAGIESLERVVEINPGAYRSQSILLTLYSALPAMLGGGDDKTAEKIAELKAQGGGVYSFAQAVSGLANGNEDEVVPQLKQAVSSEASNPDFHIALIRQLIDDEKWDEAKAALESALKLHDGYYPLMYQSIRYHVLREQIPPNLVSQIDGVIDDANRTPPRLVPEFYYLMRARARQLTGDRDGAERDYRYVYESTPRLLSESGFDKYARDFK